MTEDIRESSAAARSIDATLSVERARILYLDMPEIQTLMAECGVSPETALQLLSLAFHKHYDGAAGSLRNDIKAMLRKAVAEEKRP